MESWKVVVCFVVIFDRIQEVESFIPTPQKTNMSPTKKGSMSKGNVIFQPLIFK